MYSQSGCTDRSVTVTVPEMGDSYLNVPEKTPGIFDGPAFRDSIQQFLSENLGEYVVCEFLIGTSLSQQRQGILYSVGTNYITLYEEESNTYVICDVYALKFVTFYQPGQRPSPTTAAYGRNNRRLFRDR